MPGFYRERAKDPRGGFNPWENVHRVLPDIIAQKPRAVILNGDATSREGLAVARFRRNGVDLTLHAIAGNRVRDGETSRIIWT